jgi:hypothetical protein
MAKIDVSVAVHLLWQEYPITITHIGNLLKKYLSYIYIYENSIYKSIVFQYFISGGHAVCLISFELVSYGIKKKAP